LHAEETVVIGAKICQVPSRTFTGICVPLDFPFCVWDCRNKEHAINGKCVAFSCYCLKGC